MEISDRLDEIAGRVGGSASDAAKVLAEMERKRMTISRQSLEDFSPDKIAPPDCEFEALYDNMVEKGRKIAARSKIVFVGQARQIAYILPLTVDRVERMTEPFKDWGACVIENDSTDDTKKMLERWQDARPGKVKISCRDYGREHLRGWESDRVKRYAQYRNEGRLLAKEYHADADYVCVIDFDPWGGWSLGGLLTGLAWLEQIPSAGGMASASMFEAKNGAGEKIWAHYDQWAFRWQGWKMQIEPWFTLWIPKVGAPPIHVKSAFGAMTIYRPKPFFESEYYGGPDIEHVGLHRNMEKMGYHMFLNPSQRVVMHWLLEELIGDTCPRETPQQ